MRWTALLLIALPHIAGAANLKNETIKAWDDSVEAAQQRMLDRLGPDRSFLWSDEDAERRAKVLNGEIVVAPADPHTPKKVSSGLIHDWQGAGFVSNASLADVMAVVRNYNRYAEFYAPVVIEARGLQSSPAEDRFSIMLMNRSLLSKTALDGEYASHYVQVNDRRTYSISETTRIQEIDHPNTRNQRVLPQDEGTGFIWRLFTITRFEQRDGGVWIEVEAMALSRDIPGSLKWVVEPMVRRISKASITTSLRQTSDAVQGNANGSKGVQAPIR